MRNQAYRIHRYGGPEVFKLDDVPVPELTDGQVLVATGAAGVNGLDWKFRAGFLQKDMPLTLPAVLGCELAGTVVNTASGASRFKAGDRVMGPVGLGAYVDFAAVDERGLCLTPDGLSDIDAAAIPIAALTAWQALHVAGALGSGTIVLIHSAAGGVGGFAVQFAKAAGAVVFATASATSRGHVLGLGADVVIDYRAERFEDLAKDVDLVLDTIGGETLDRSWQLLSSGGAIVSIAAPDIATRTPSGARGVWLSMRPEPDRLQRIAEDAASSKLRSTIDEIFDFADLPAALERNQSGHGPGKIVIEFKR